MSEQGDVVKELLGAHEDRNVLEAIHETMSKVDEGDAGRDAMIAALKADQGWRHYSPDVVWDMSETGLGAPVHGVPGLFEWFRDWAARFSDYKYTVAPGDYEDLQGGRVLTKGVVEATAHNGQTVSMPVWQTWTVAEGEVTGMKAFLSEKAARS
jgi:hypothetical protein